MSGQKMRPPGWDPAAQESLSENSLVENSEHTPAEPFGQRRQGRPRHLCWFLAAAVTTIASQGLV